MDVPKDQMSILIENGLYDSAKTLGSFLVSSSAVNADANPQIKAESLVLLGDALFHDREYRRAIHSYKQALHYQYVTPKQIAISLRSSFSASSKTSPNSFQVSEIIESEVKFKIASCHGALNETKAALMEMEGIPSKARNLQMNLLMGKLYRNSRHLRSAVACYKECLRQCPCVIEAIIALAELGISARDIISLFSQTLNRSGRSVFDQLDSSRWLQRYIEAQCAIASNDYNGSLELFSELLQRFPSNIHLLLESAKVQAIIGKSDDAIMNFEKARAIDPYIVTYMDEYAVLLNEKSEYPKLQNLVHDLLSIDSAKPEAFVAMAVLWEKKDERGALSYAEKSTRIDNSHIPGYIVKGGLLLSLNSPEAAVTAFRTAQELRPDIRAYQGLVRSYLVLSKTKEALYTSREAMKIMPHCARAIKLVADVHACSIGGREKAIKFYEAALRMEPDFLGAALTLAEVFFIEGRTGDAISLLERYLRDRADDSLHVKLAQVFAATNMLQEALSHYQTALRINPRNEAMKKGLERLEKQMKGIDPDAPEEEENDAEDVDGDQEEAELL